MSQRITETPEYITDSALDAATQSGVMFLHDRTRHTFDLRHIDDVVIIDGVDYFYEDFSVYVHCTGEEMYIIRFDIAPGQGLPEQLYLLCDN